MMSHRIPTMSRDQPNVVPRKYANVPAAIADTKEMRIVSTLHAMWRSNRDGRLDGTEPVTQAMLEHWTAQIVRAAEWYGPH